MGRVQPPLLRLSKLSDVADRGFLSAAYSVGSPSDQLAILMLSGH